MHQTRQEISKKLPIRRKGTKYVARAIGNQQNSVAIVIALRDMLHLARTAKEVREMIKDKTLSINGRIVDDYREAINLFSILNAGKNYKLMLSDNGKFIFEEAKDMLRLGKVIRKTLLRENKIQLTLHDGANIVTKDKIAVGDSLYLDFEGKIKKHVSVDKGKEVYIISGKYSGKKAKIESTEGKSVALKLENKIQTQLNNSQVVAI